MKRVRLTLDLAGVHPVFDLLTDSPHVERAAVHHWNVTDEGTSTVIIKIDGDSGAVADKLETIGFVEYERVTAGDEVLFFLRDEGTAGSRAVIRSLTADGLLVVPPVEYDRCGGTVTVVGDAGTIQRAVDSVAAEVEVRVEEVGDSSSAFRATAGLSERQREAARVGVELGYYDAPRGATVEDVARALECAPSTAAEHLRKARARVMRASLEE